MIRSIFGMIWGMTTFFAKLTAMVLVASLVAVGLVLVWIWLAGTRENDV